MFHLLQNLLEIFPSGIAIISHCHVSLSLSYETCAADKGTQKCATETTVKKANSVCLILIYQESKSDNHENYICIFCSPLWAFLDLHTSFLPSSIFSTGVQCLMKPTTWVCVKISHLHIMSNLLPAILLLFRFQNTKKNLSKSWVAKSQSNLTFCNKLFWRL
jgi:hypothetical protein